jgi:hypothetical protein
VAADELVPLRVPEPSHLLIRRHASPHCPIFILGWSYWQRRHQATVRACHIKRRRAALGEKRSLQD